MYRLVGVSSLFQQSMDLQTQSERSSSRKEEGRMGMPVMSQDQTQQKSLQTVNSTSRQEELVWLAWDTLLTPLLEMPKFDMNGIFSLTY